MFEYGDHNVQGFHFTEAFDRQYIDGVDVALSASHGAPNFLVLSGVGDFMEFEDCSWGDNDLEWIFLHGCHTTNTSVYFKNPRAMNGVRLVCGFETEGWDMNDGAALAHELLSGSKVVDAWFNATEITHYPPIRVRVFGETLDCRDEHIWGHGSQLQDDPPVDSQVYDWIHACQY